MKIYSFAAGGKKEDEVPILPRFTSDSIIDLKDEKKGVESEIEAVDRAKLVSGKRKISHVPEPTNIVIKKKVKKTSACLELCEGIGMVFYYFCFLILGLCLAKELIDYEVGLQMKHHNNRLKCLQNNQNILYNAINDVIAKVSNLTVNHNDTKDELYVVEYSINDLHKDLQTLKDSVNLIEEERLHSDDDIELDGDDDSHDVVLDYPRYPDTSSPISPTSEGKKDSDDLQYDNEEDEEDPTNYMMSSATAVSSSPLETTSQAPLREEYPVDYSEYDTEGKIYYIH